MLSAMSVQAPAAQPVAADLAVSASADAAQQDGLRAFEAEMRRHNQRLFRLAFALVGDEAEAEDVLQDSYVRAYEHLATFAGRSGIGLWLARIVRNQAIDHLRVRQARQAAIALEAELPPRPDGADGYLERAAAPSLQASVELDRSREEVRAMLQQAIAMLAPHFRAVFMLREVEGMSVEDTAAYLGIPVATVKSRDHRARILLKQELGPAFKGHVGDVFEFQRERCDRIVARVRDLLTAS
jgi:RNA polymerase sigma-70 factor (ECF subfamily)